MLRNIYTQDARARACLICVLLPRVASTSVITKESSLTFRYTDKAFAETHIALTCVKDPLIIFFLRQ